MLLPEKGLNSRLGSTWSIRVGIGPGHSLSQGLRARQSWTPLCSSQLALRASSLDKDT